MLIFSVFRERRLIRRLKERDEDAFREMVRDYHRRVYTLVFRMLGNREEAEDLSQEVFVTVFKSIDSFREESKFSTWLYRVTVNTCKNRYKFLSRRNFHNAKPLDDISERDAAGRDGGPVMALQAQVSRPDQMVEGLQMEAAIQKELAALPEDQRTLIVLRDIQGLAYDEIARIEGLKAGTVKSRLHRARMALKNRMKKYM